MGYGLDANVDIYAKHKRPAARDVVMQRGLVVEDRASHFTGAIVSVASGLVVLEDGHGRQRNFQLLPGAFAIDGEAVTLVMPRREDPAAAVTASGATAVRHAARVALPSRIWVEGTHDAELIEQVWGDELRAEGIVVEPLGGIDDLAELVREFSPSAERRLGILVDHLVPGSKESRIAATVSNAHVLITGHDAVDVWSAVKPRALGIDAWPDVPMDEDYKQGLSRRLGDADVHDTWRRIKKSVTTFADLDRSLVGAVEQLLDFLITPGDQ